MPSVTIDLKRPITTHDGPVTAWTLREPRLSDLIEVGGLPWDTLEVEGARPQMPDNMQRIGAYLERLTEKPSAEFIRQVGLADGLKLKDVVVRFFTDAAVETYGKPPTSSSSNAGPQPSASAATSP